MGTKNTHPIGKTWASIATIKHELFCSLTPILIFILAIKEYSLTDGMSKRVC
jgi:hypothetical protein